VTDVLYAVDGPVATITLNRPDRLNAIVPGMGEEYAAALLRADADPEVRAIVVTGSGRGFCAGADLDALAEGPQTLARYLDGQTPDTLPTLALRLRTPVATAVNGPCAGIGFVLAISADARFAHPTATMSTTFARLGLIAEYGVAWLLTRLVGLAAATDLLLTGRTLTGEQAHAMGLVTAVDEDPVAAATAWARELAERCSPSAMAVMKAQLLQADGQRMDEAVVTSLAEMRRAFERPDLAEAVAARAQKRLPVFPPLS
jgi:enoyl-CoA hydratase/carnithine racemase